VLRLHLQVLRRGARIATDLDDGPRAGHDQQAIGAEATRPARRAATGPAARPHARRGRVRARRRGAPSP
jgi:hypothetical protein